MLFDDGSDRLAELTRGEDRLVGGLSVRDRGPGIAPADAPRLFERFYRGDAARTRASGSGSGLWIARRLLDAEGGRVWAENHPDGGALFTIVVPAQRALAGLLADQRA